MLVEHKSPYHGLKTYFTYISSQSSLVLPLSLMHPVPSQESRPSLQDQPTDLFISHTVNS